MSYFNKKGFLMNKRFFMITLLVSASAFTNVCASVVDEVREFVAPTHVDVEVTARV